jgi:hypothetical protein
VVAAVHDVPRDGGGARSDGDVLAEAGAVSLRTVRT